MKYLARTSWRSPSALAMLVFCMLALLTGCAGASVSVSGNSPSPSPTSELHLPQVALIPGITQLQNTPSSRGIAYSASYLPADGSGQPRMLFVLGRNLSDPYTTLYDVRLDGGDLRRLQLTSPCTARFAITPDGREVACSAGNHITLLALTGSSAAPTHTDIVDTGDALPQDLAWAPNGHQLAVITREGVASAQRCDLRIYTASAALRELYLAAVLTFAQFPVPAEGCAIHAPSWSPTGDWLTVSSLQASRDTIYGLRISSLLPRLAQPSATPVTLAITPQMLTTLGTTAAGVAPAWSPSSGRLTVVAQDTRTISMLDAQGAQSQTLLSQQVGEICGLSWAPDGKQLVFGLCFPTGGDYPAQPEQLYTYTPAS